MLLIPKYFANAEIMMGSSVDCEAIPTHWKNYPWDEWCPVYGFLDDVPYEAIKSPNGDWVAGMPM